MRWVREDGGECGDVGEAHCFAYSCMVLETESGYECSCYRGESGEVNFYRGHVVFVVCVGVWMVRSVRTDGFEDVFEVVGDEVESHEEEEDRHGEASQNFCTFETERVAD